MYSITGCSFFLSHCIVTQTYFFTGLKQSNRPKGKEALLFLNDVIPGKLHLNKKTYLCI